VLAHAAVRLALLAGRAICSIRARPLESGMGSAMRATIFLLLTTVIPAAGGAEPDFDAQRRRMVEEVAAMGRSTAREIGRDGLSAPVLRALEAVPRHRFVPDNAVHAAYRNRPLSIGQGQTISQPYIVALSAELIEPEPDHNVLEVGTGSGYQAAILAELVRNVYSIEIIEPLGRQAADRLVALDYLNVEVRIGDGYQGWPEKAPFDGIVVTAAAPLVPMPLVEQLKPGGRMVIPVGRRSGEQELLLVVKRPDGVVEVRSIISVRFVPLTGPGADANSSAPAR
jgi:protein-L-isoaspartate(D-aspartate) O-methyltransferase